MPFKIVETTEKGTTKLLVVPSAWELKGQLRYPKKTIDFKFAKDENSSPRADWPVMVCKLKRTGFPTYNDAEEELSIMLQNSDTDIGGYEENRRGNIPATVSMPDFNSIADQLIFQQPQHNATQNVITDTTEGTYYNIVGEGNEILTTLNLQSLQTEPDIITQKLDKILNNQKNILEIQNKFAKRLGNFVLEIENKIEKSVTRVLKQKLNDQTVVQLAQVDQTANTAISFKPIDSVKQLEEFELLLSDPIENQKFLKLFSILCTTSDGRGISCAYKLSDVLFTREFLCKCSWSGGSRGEKIKIPLKKYKNILDFCFNMVWSWDKTFTIEECENFFKTVLRNAEQRKKVKHIRKPAQRRSRKVKKQAENPVKTKKVETDMEKEVEIEMEQEVEKETEKETDTDAEIEKESEKKTDADEDMEKDSEKETDVDEETEKESEKETDVDEETEKESEKETDADEEMEKESENNPEKGTDADKLVEKEREKDINMEEEMEKGKEKENKDRKTVQNVLQNEKKYKPNAVKIITTVDKEETKKDRRQRRDADEEMEKESEKETDADEEIEKESEKNPEKGTDADKLVEKEREKDINMEEEMEKGKEKENKDRKTVQNVLQNEKKYKPNAVKNIKTVDKEDHSSRKPTKEHKLKVLKRIKPVNDENSSQTPPKKQKPMKVLND